MKIYLDTNIYMDYFDGRNDYMRPLGEFAFQIFQRTLSCEFSIVISSSLLKELHYNQYTDKIKELFEELEEKNKLIIAQCTSDDVTFAEMLSKKRGSPFADTLHAVIAKRMQAEWLITRNVKDYEELQDIIRISLPEML